MDHALPRVFVITPFNADSLALFEELQRVFEKEYEFKNAGDMDNQENILQDIVEGINSAQVVIADLTGLNPNVFYELGLAHAMNKKVIIITQDINELPFDIKSYRVNEYSLQFNKLPALIEKLKKLLFGAIDNSVKYGNPVSDYLPNFFNYKEKTETKAIEDSIPIEIKSTADEKSEEDGFLDYLTDVDEYSNKLTNEISEIGIEMQEINFAVSKAANDINQIKNKSGSADVSYVRSVCRKLSIPIEEFATKFHTHNQNISIFWNIIENSYLSLLDSKYTQTGSNLSSIKESMVSLDELQKVLLESNKKIEGFILALQGNYGIERKMNKAISSLKIELEDYLSVTETMSASVDRITAKSKIVVNKIEDQ